MKSKIAKMVLVVTGIYVICAILIFGRKESDAKDINMHKNCINIQSEEFHNNYVDMRKVTDFQVNKDGNGFTLYLENGEGYYWER